jgi:hypothetical protein
VVSRQWHAQKVGNLPSRTALHGVQNAAVLEKPGRAGWISKLSMFDDPSFTTEVSIVEKVSQKPFASPARGPAHPRRRNAAKVHLKWSSTNMVRHQYRKKWEKKANNMSKINWDHPILLSKHVQPHNRFFNSWTLPRGFAEMTITCTIIHSRLFHVLSCRFPRCFVRKSRC